jgi:hypothetical protein
MKIRPEIMSPYGFWSPNAIRVIFESSYDTIGNWTCDEEIKQTTNSPLPPIFSKPFPKLKLNSTAAEYREVVTLSDDALWWRSSAMLSYRGVRLLFHIFLKFAPVQGHWLASRPSRFAPMDIARNTPKLGGWLSPRAG